MRNVLIAAGNAGLSALVPHVRKHLDDLSPVVRGTAIWALSRLLPPSDVVRLKEMHSLRETDKSVMEEWNAISDSA